MSPREKADALYTKVMAYNMDKQANEEMGREAKARDEKFIPESVDPYLISEIKVLFADEAVKRINPETYGEARIDAKNFRLSELGNFWNEVNEEIAIKQEMYKQLERQLHLNEISGKGKISSARSRMAMLAENLDSLEQRKKNLETLQGFPETKENTDTVASFQYKNFIEYKRQLDDGFVWLPSRKQIHRETTSAILNHRWPVLIGEAGSGKSYQANAAAVELTGSLPTEIECESTTGETQLIKDISIDPKSGGSYENYESLMRAYTGYEDSRQKQPAVKTGRIARFDESGRLGAKAYSIIKKVRQKKEGDEFYGHPVLPGASAIWTSNPVGPRYPDRHAPDPAMRRELAEIYVDYPDMTNESPELYEFALTALLDENNSMAAAKEELAPAYEKKEIDEDQREVLEDGSIVVAKDEIIENMADSRHGALWRFSGAIRSLQDSFIYGNMEADRYPDTLLRFKEDADGDIEITTDSSGEPMTLSTSTVTLGELASWMSGFNERKQKQDQEFRVDTLTEWLDFKINTYLKQADKADRKKIEAIFKHFHLLENSVPDLQNTKPLTPKEIGYLSPRVPRPVHLENPSLQGQREEDVERDFVKDARRYETRQVLLEDDNTRILIKESEVNLGGEDVHIGDMFIVNGESFSFAGIVEDDASEHNGKPIGQLAGGEELYKVFNPEELDLGVLERFKNIFGQNLGIVEKDIDNFYELEKK